ncbi:hypothetical protein GA0115255_116841, partial [Streptomyces sp. Ncost-T6T-2b]
VGGCCRVGPDLMADLAGQLEKPGEPGEPGARGESEDPEKPEGVEK